MQARLRAAGVTELFPVQTSTYSLFVDEGNELIVKSRTGTGKTLSFLLPLEYLLKHAPPAETQENRGKMPVRGIILEPTRELATQVQAQVEKFTALNSCLLYGGGESKQSQYGLVRKNHPEVLVCTPGRLIDVIESYQLDLSGVEYFVLDEGDRMLDMGFQDDIMKI
jgi:ATP-dependent RNA helicase RhlE